LITYGVSRGLNGAISVAQGTELAIQPAGVGLNFTPGEILDPINDLVERFSWVVLVSGTSLGIQRVLLNVTAWPWFTLLVSVILLVSLVYIWKPDTKYQKFKSNIFRLALILVILRFSIPVIAIMSEAIYNFFLEPQYSESTRKLEQTAERITSINRAAQPELSEKEGKSLLDEAKRFYNSAAELIDVESRMNQLKNVAAEVSEYAINLIVVFVLQTIIFPLVFLYIMVHLLKKIAVTKFTR
jgi:ABC-type multidrug transport system fused ATPase/permease subunit